MPDRLAVTLTTAAVLLVAGCASSAVEAVAPTDDQVALAATIEPSTRPADPERVATWEPEIAKDEAANESAVGRENNVVFVGSSTIGRWNLREYFPGYPAVNSGFGGSTMRDIRPFADRAILRYEPDVVVVYSGDNDLVWVEPEAVASEFAGLVDYVREASPETPFVVISVKPSVARVELTDKILRTNDLLEAYAATTPGVTYVDIEQPVLDADGKPRPEMFVEDGLHLSPAGYEMLTERVRPLLPQAPAAAIRPN